MKTYLFDFDGTLVDSMPAFGSAMKSVLDDFSVKYGDDIVKTITPLGYEGSAKYFQSIGLDLPTEKILEIMRKKLVYEYTYNVNAKKDVVESLLELKKRGCSLNILTASPHLVVDPCLKRIGIYEIFDKIWSCEDFGTVKSDPNIYKMAAKCLEKEVEEVIFLDDNYFSAKTAKEAGMISVGVYDDSSKEYVEEMKANTDGYIYSFKELL
jgi:HAD superfamily hydrolase (TIGR01509 family)